MEAVKQAALAKSTPFEKFIYGIGSVGALLCWTYMAMYVVLYYTDSAGLAAATAGTIMLVGRFLDGVSDIACAWLFRKVHFKLGHIRPWFMVCAPMLTLALLLVFNVPQGLSSTGKIAYAAITYTYTGAIAYTIFNLAFSSILPLMSYDPADRERTDSVGFFIMQIGVIGINTVSPMLIAWGGGSTSQAGWRMISIIYSIACGVLVFLMGACIKEKEPPAEYQEQLKAQTSVSFKEGLKMAFANKWTWILMIIFIVKYFCCDGISGIAAYFWRDVMGNLSYITIGSMIQSCVLMLGILVGPVLFRKFGRNRTMVTCLIFYVIFGVIFWFVKGNLAPTLIIYLLRELCFGPLWGAIWLLIPDLSDYFAKTKKVQIVETVSMSASIGVKLGVGLGAATVGWVLGAFGYDASLAAQTAHTQIGINLLMVIVPIIGGLVLMLLLKIWPYGKKENETKNTVEVAQQEAAAAQEQTA